MRPTDNEIEAMAELSRLPHWKFVHALLEREIAAQSDTLAQATELHAIHRAQGALSALKGFVELVEKAGSLTLEKRDRHTKVGPRTPAIAGAWT